MKIINGVLVACLLSVIFFSISAADSFRCGSHIIEEGMQRSEVLEYCGQPTEEAGWTWHYDRESQNIKILVHFDADGTVNRIEEEPGD